MFTNTKCSIYAGQDKVYTESVCLSTDVKPTTGIANGSTCIEMNTGKKYMFNEDSGEWVEVPSSGGGGGGGGGDSITWIMPEQTVTLVDQPVEVTGVDFGLIPEWTRSVPLKFISQSLQGEVTQYKELNYSNGSLGNDYFFVGVVNGKMSFAYLEDEEIISGTYTISIGLF